jgi:hypothetical protein
MSLTSAIPASGSIINTGDTVTVVTDDAGGIVSITHVRTGSGASNEVVYTDAGGYQTGFTGSYEEGGGEARAIFRRDAGWDSSTFRVDIVTASAAYSVNYILFAQGQYPPDMIPFNDPIEGSLVVTEDSVVVESGTAILDFDDATFTVTNPVDGKVRIVGTASVGSGFPSGLGSFVYDETTSQPADLAELGGGVFRLNHSNPASADEMYIANISDESWSGYGLERVNGWLLRLSNSDGSEKGSVFCGLPVAGAGGGWWTIPVTAYELAGATDGETFQFTLQSNTIEGTVIGSTGEGGGLVLKTDGSEGAVWGSVAGTGDVVSSESSGTVFGGEIAVFDGTTGKLIEGVGVGVAAESAGLGSFTYSTTTAQPADLAELGPGNFRFNHSSPSSATEMYISNVTLESWIATHGLEDLEGWRLRLTTQDATVAASVLCGAIVGGAGGGWITVQDITAYSNPSWSSLDGERFYFTVQPSSLGDVIGPSSAADNRIAVFDSTTGKLIKEGSTASINPVSGHFEGTGATVTGTLIAANLTATTGTISTQDGSVYVAGTNRSLLVEEGVEAEVPSGQQSPDMGQYWSRTSDGHPMFTTSTGTDYDLSTGAAGGGQTDTVGGQNGLQNTGDDVDAMLEPVYGTSANTLIHGDDGRLSDPRTPNTHASSHGNASGDEIDVTGLSGLLADKQYSGIQDGGTPDSDAFTLNFGSNLTASVTAGVATINASASGAAGVYGMGHWTYDDTVAAAADPGTGNFRLDHSNPTSATEMYISSFNGDSQIMSYAIEALEGWRIAANDPTGAEYFNSLCGTPVIDSGWYTIPIAPVGTSFTDAVSFAFTVAPSQGFALIPDGSTVADNAIIRGDGGEHGVQDSSVAITDGGMVVLGSGSAAVQIEERNTGPTFAGGTGQYWVRDDAPSTPMFTGDTGTEIDLSVTTDDDAVHVNIDGEITAIDEKTSPTVTDIILIEDSAVSGVKKSIQIGNLPILTGQAGALVVDARASGGDIAIGQAVYITGWNIGAGVIEVDVADASSAATMPSYGVARDAITSAATGTIIVSGELLSQKTDYTDWAAGDALYVDATTPGALTRDKPEGTDLVQKVGIINRVHSSSGIIQVVGAGRSNDLPNLPEDYVWLGDSNGVPAETTRAGIDSTATQAAAVVADNELIRGDGSQRGVQTSSGNTLSDTGDLILTGDLTATGGIATFEEVQVDADLTVDNDVSVGNVLDVTGDITVGGTVDGVDVAGHVGDITTNPHVVDIDNLPAWTLSALNANTADATLDDITGERTPLNDSVTQAKMADNAVGLAELAHGTADKYLGFDGSGNPAELSPAGGTVDTFGSPLDNDFAKFTGATTIEGRSYAEVKADLNLEIGTDIDAAGTDNSTDVTLAGEDFLSLSSQEVTANPINLDNLSATGTPSSSTFLRGDNTWDTPIGTGDLLSTNNLSDVDDSDASRVNLGAETLIPSGNTAARPGSPATDDKYNNTETGSLEYWTGSAWADVGVPVDDATIEVDGTNGLQVKDGGIDTTQLADDAVTLAKMADMATASIIGRDAGGTGIPEVLDASTARTVTGTHGAHTGGDVTGSETLTIVADAVTYAKMQNVVADDVILGNIGGAGSIVDELTGTEVTALLNVATTSLPGLGPARTGGASTDYLSADGTYSVPPGGGIGTLDAVINTASDNDVTIPTGDPLIFRDGAVANVTPLSLERTGSGTDPVISIATGNIVTPAIYSTDGGTNSLELTGAGLTWDSGTAAVTIGGGTNGGTGGADLFVTAQRKSTTGNGGDTYIDGGDGVTGATDGALYLGTYTSASVSIGNAGAPLAIHDGTDVGANTHVLTSNGTTQTWEAQASAPTLTKSITIEDPVTLEDITFFYTPVAITITQIAAVIRGSSPSVKWYLVHETMTTGRDTAGNLVINGGTTTTDEGGVSITSFDDATVPADSFLWVTTTDVSGTNAELALTVKYTED